MVEFEERLKKAGLTGNESKVYLELLRRGSISANELSKKVSLDRTLTYTLLNNMIERGFVTYVIKDKKKYFSAADPHSLLNPVREQEAYILDLIPQLRAIERVKEEYHGVEIYEGHEGLKTYLRNFIRYKEFFSFGSTGRAYDLVYEAPKVAEALAKGNFHGKIITTPKFEAHPLFKMKNIQCRCLDVESEATTNIFGDNVSISMLKQKPFVIVIRSKVLAESFRNHFEVLWKVAKPLK